MMCDQISPWVVFRLAFVAGLTAFGAPAKADCDRTPVEIARVWGPRNLEQAELVLSLCTDQPNLEALDELSILARPQGTDRPTSINSPSDEFVADRIKRLDPRLLSRLQAIADRWPGHRIHIVSGYRPTARDGSRHRHAQALDIEVQGVPKEELVAFAKTIPGTGVGFYPNSVLTHIDVREQSYAWVDVSAPGEGARYTAKGLVDPEMETGVASASTATLTEPAPTASKAKPPMTKGPYAATDVRSETLARVREALKDLEQQSAARNAAPVASAAEPPAAAASAPTEAPPEPVFAPLADASATARDAAYEDEPPLTADEIRQLREEALATVRALTIAPVPAAPTHSEAVAGAAPAPPPPWANIEAAPTSPSPAPGTTAPSTTAPPAEVAPAPRTPTAEDAWTPPWDA
jgi:hypothetical protein